MPRKAKSRTITVFLLKDREVDLSKVLKPRNQVREIPVTIEGQPLGRLFIQASQDKLPSWLSLFRGAVEERSIDAFNASTAAVWILELDEHVFALTFGYGRNLLRSGSWEEDFGLKVTLNAVNPDKIRSLDRMTLDAISQHSRIQASRDANIGEFGLDLEQDLLRAVTGTPIETGLGKRMTGRDALQASVSIQLQDVPNLVSRYLEESKKQSYKKRYPWVDRIHEITDPVKQGELDNDLFVKLKTKDLDGLWLAVPEMLDMENLEGFRYRNAGQAQTYPDLHVTTFLDEVKDHANIDGYCLKKRYHVYAISSENEAVIRYWPVYRCLYCEVHTEKETFLLNNGKWFRIASDFVLMIDEAIEQIPSQTIQLPRYSDKSEGQYNARIARENSECFALMDQKLIRSPEMPNQIEFCDLFSSQKHLIHLKRYRGSSALSHLFAQGVVSGKLFMNDAHFRSEVNEKLPNAFRIDDPEKRPQNNEYEVVFGIISQSEKKLRLPFFSRVNLKNSYQDLNLMGYRVSICKVSAAAD